jgi:hypothetical protein
MDGGHVNKLGAGGNGHGASFEAGMSSRVTYQCPLVDGVELDDGISPSLSKTRCRRGRCQSPCLNVGDREWDVSEDYILFSYVWF